MSAFKVYYCIYCGVECHDRIRIADGTKGHRTNPATHQIEEIMSKAPQYIDVCEKHKQQVLSALGEKIKQPRRAKVLAGQMSIEDYLQ
jgi:hypothetical protein